MAGVSNSNMPMDRVILVASQVAYCYQTEENILDIAVTVVQTFAFFFQAEDGIRDIGVTGVQTCALPIFSKFPLSVLFSDAIIPRYQRFMPFLPLVEKTMSL